MLGDADVISTCFFWMVFRDAFHRVSRFRLTGLKKCHIHLSLEVIVQLCPAHLVSAQPCWLHIGITLGFLLCVRVGPFRLLSAHHSSSQMIHHASSYLSITLLIFWVFSRFGWEKSLLGTLEYQMVNSPWFLKECWKTLVLSWWFSLDGTEELNLALQGLLQNLGSRHPWTLQAFWKNPEVKSIDVQG